MALSWYQMATDPKQPNADPQAPGEAIDPVDEASEESFPASDPPAWSVPEHAPGNEVLNNQAEHRFEVHRDGQTAFLTYRIRPDALVFVHTEVPAGLEGHGIGGKLIRFAL